MVVDRNWTNLINNHLSEYGDVQLCCPVYITQGIHDPGNERVLQQICGLLNSGGGIIVMKNEDVTKNVLTKHLDAWWSGMEANIATILDLDDICNFVDFVGNFDDVFFYLFVKSAEQLCTIGYNCRLPTDTATHEVSYKSAVRLCRRQGKVEPLERLPAIPSQFEYKRTEETLKQEGKQIQFKLVSNRKESASSNSIAHKVNKLCSRYISAFANHEGGHIYFGIEDTTAGVYGEEISLEDETRIVDSVTHRMKSMIWSDDSFEVCKGVHWDVRFLPIIGCPMNERRRVIVISVCKMYGGVFTYCPESYLVYAQTERGRRQHSVHKLKFYEWKNLLLNQTRDCPSLHSRFVKLPLLTPQSRLTFSLPHTLQSARQKVIKLSTGLNLHPKNCLQNLTNTNVKPAVLLLLSTFAEEDHLVIALDSWGLSLPPLPTVKPQNVLVCLAIFSSVYGLQIVSLVDRGAAEEDAWRYTSDMAIGFKQCLVMHGGCHSHVGIKIHVLDIMSPIMLEMFQGAISVDIYPQTYVLGEQEMDKILNALTIAIASYKPFSNNSRDGEPDHYFLLTCDQLELLWSHQFTKELWVHGPPGAGKTVAALEMVKEFGRRGCEKSQILYVAENSLICSYVRSFDICLVVSRRELMSDTAVPDLMNSKYRQVKNVIVDEAQNFKSRDGDWYSVLEKLSRQNVTDQCDVAAGYFWVFMDYAQKVHKFEAGLPGLIGKNNFMLSEISRNSKEIFEYASKFMENPSAQNNNTEHTSDIGSSPHKALQVAPVLGHQFSSGQDVNVLKCDKSSMHDVLFQVLQKFSQEGVGLNDMAILVSKKKDTEEIQQSIKTRTDLFGGLQSMTNKPTSNVPPALGLGPPSQGVRLGSGFDSSFSNTIDKSSSGSRILPATDIGVGSSQNKFSKPDVVIKDIEMSTDHHVATTSFNQSSSSSPFHGSVTSGKGCVHKPDPVLVSTVRDFSGLDKSVIVGMEPHANPDHADLEKLIANLATRAKDSLVILTTSDDLMGILKPS